SAGGRPGPPGQHHGPTAAATGHSPAGSASGRPAPGSAGAARAAVLHAGRRQLRWAGRLAAAGRRDPGGASGAGRRQLVPRPRPRARRGALTFPGTVIGSDQILHLLDQAITETSRLGREDLAGRLTEQRDQVTSGAWHVLVAGEFKK